MEHFERMLRIIESAVRSIKEDEFTALMNDCVDTINAGGKIITSGLGKNVPVCEKFTGTLNSISIAATFMHTNSAVHGDLGIVKNNDLVIILTKSGETLESIHLVNLLKMRSCKVWLLSFSRNSTLYNNISNHIIIELEHEGDRWNILPNNSTVLNLIVLQELAMQLADVLDIKLDVLRDNHPGGAIGVELSG